MEGETPEQTVDVDQLIADYVEARELLKRVDTHWEKQREPLLKFQERISGRIQAFMASANIKESLKSKSGTAYLSTRYSASVQDGEAFMNFVKAGNWDMIERRANPTAVKDYVKANNQLPAGVNLTAVQTLGVRRPGKAKED